MGKIELDHTGSGGGITLSSDGTSLLLGGTAIGGSALELYAENYDGTSTLPIATGTNAVALNVQAEATGSYSTALGYDAVASGSFSTASGQGASAGSSRSVALGYLATTATGSNAVALGRSYASGTDSFAAAITNNTSSYGAVAGNSIVIGRNSKATAGYNYGIAIGNTNTVQASESYCFGANCTVTQTRSLAIGNRATVYSEGKMAFASSRFAANGDGQAGTFVLMRSTTDATAATLATANSTPNANNQVALPNNSAYAFHGTIVARQQASGGTACAAWKIEGLIRREGSAGTTTLVNSATTVLDNTPSWGMALSADTTNGCLKIEVTGAASTNIRWVGTIHTSEVTYA